MKFKGNPNQLVRITKVQRHLIRKVPRSIRFDENGIYETENSYLIKRLLVKFQEIQEVKEVKEVNYKTMDYKLLQSLYAEKTGNTAVGVKKDIIIKVLEE